MVRCPVPVICLPRHRLHAARRQTISLDRRSAGHSSRQLADMWGIVAGDEKAIRRSKGRNGQKPTHVVRSR
jgi:hypothetical protein